MSLLKRLLSVFLMVFLVLPVCAVKVDANDTNEPSRVINVVYDDSQSMFLKKADTWCKAKYAMEVCAAMLGENDTMNIFVMSDFDNGKKGKVRLPLKGSDGAAVNVKKVHEMLTKGMNTPIASVEGAFNDVKDKKSDEKWLLVLTDGRFEYGPNEEIPEKDVQAMFDKWKGNGVKIMLFSMSADVALTPDESNDFYFRQAKNTSDILNSITEISKQLVNANEIKVNSDKEIELAVPMRELIVFAQGKEVNIGAINPAGEGVRSEMSDVKYSTKATSDSSFDGKVTVDKNLVGKVATYKGYFPMGKYSLSVTGEDTLTVFYKPYIDIMATVDGETNLSNLEAGEHKIRFEIVDGNTGKVIKDSEAARQLLGNIDYQATITSVDPETGDKKTEEVDGQEATIVFNEGSMTIDAEATFLDYNHARTTTDYYIFRNKTVELEEVECPAYLVKKTSIENGDQPLKVKATLEGKEFTPEQWNTFTSGQPNIKVKVRAKEDKDQDDVEERYGQFKVQFGQNPGEIEIYPALPGEKAKYGKYKPVDIVLAVSNEIAVGSGSQAKEKWKGKAKLPVNITDGRNPFEIFLPWILMAIAILIIGIIINGYLPWKFGKRYLPKKLSRSPLITCRPVGEMAAYSKKKTVTGSYKLDKKTRFIPYLTEKGTIRFVPSGKNVASLQVKGANSGYMYITNIKSYAGNKNIKFDGAPVESGTTAPMRVTGGLTTEYKTPHWIYSCDTSQGK